MITLTEENYLKALYRLSMGQEPVSVKSIAGLLDIKMPTVTSMVNKLAEKKLVRYEKYKAIELTERGKKAALHILRKHRLTELFLTQVMGLGWEEVHDIAEQVEHIQSERFFNRVDEMLGFPRFDPHGEPIPDASGKLPVMNAFPLSNGTPGKKYKLAGVLNHEPSFLTFLNSLQLALGTAIEIKQVQVFDASMEVVLNGKTKTVFSSLVCENLLVL
ncbi:metal-dependent transcriptional regulator [Deminuibacter soli]|uniref:Transcriptional regulator MntR n=1 Tax=Deminuibacter soli TaxID=2291815 RepID=A0A3E1NHT1_9BACT|nr:metal-dependent transcriptional regulator [Deminuibacter soli]RFM27442.1 metal-dependent transcriptional regulator [Deminuibacter soli]